MRKRLTLTASIRQAATSPFGGVAAARDARVMLTYDVSLAWTALLLLAFGLVMVYSASIAMSEASTHTGNRAWYFLMRHGMFVVVGLRRRCGRVPGAGEGLATAGALAVHRRRQCCCCSCWSPASANQ